MTERPAPLLYGYGGSCASTWWRAGRNQFLSELAEEGLVGLRPFANLISSLCWPTRWILAASAGLLTRTLLVGKAGVRIDGFGPPATYKINDLQNPALSLGTVLKVQYECG